MKRLALSCLLLSIALLTFGCSSAANSMPTEAPLPAAPLISEAYDNSSPGLRSSQGMIPAAQPTAAPAATAAPGALGTASDADIQRMIVYTGSVSLQVNDTTDAINKITDILKGVNGYIANKSLAAYGKDKLRGTIVIRVPAAALDSVLGQIKALGVRVLKEDANSNDVTEEYVDLDARRKNLEAYEVELTKLLDTVRERTGKAEDILAVYNQLTKVRGQIEQITGRQKYLENTSTLATYTIDLVPIEEVVVEGQVGWDPGRTAGQALDQLVTTLQGLGDLAIVLVLYVLPVLFLVLLPLVIVVLILRAVLKRRAPKKPVPAS
ncbi:MAG TPA: DUF4349 domain-containing protein [Anaerolineae bacterium]|nr:DUF4349 domain-containing protein [Anaerolineae bacterium]